MASGSFNYFAVTCICLLLSFRLLGGAGRKTRHCNRSLQSIDDIIITVIASLRSTSVHAKEDEDEEEDGEEEFFHPCSQPGRADWMETSNANLLHVRCGSVP